MNEIDKKYFDPTETIRGIQQLLVSDKKKIAFLFGAGTSFANSSLGMPFIPAIREMTQKIEDIIKSKEAYSSTITEIKEELSATYMGFNIESLLTNIETKVHIIGNGKLNNLDKSGFETLAGLIKSNIREIVSIHTEIAHNEKKLIQYEFAKWIRNADRKYAVEIFTTNYDYLFEIGLEAAEVPYYDGFTGSYMSFFNPDSLEDMNFLPRQTKLWKIHGSLGLHEDSDRKKIIRKSSDLDDFLIYPSTLKYSSAKKMPYAAFIDRLNAFLKQDDAVLFICGYSFGDEHINERILSALNANSTSHVFVLYYDKKYSKDSKKEYTFTPDCYLANSAFANGRISILGTRNAIIGSVYGTWKLKREPDKNDTFNVQLFFDEDAPINTNMQLKNESKGGEVWTGEGELILPDFIHFVSFLKNMIPYNERENDANE